MDFYCSLFVHVNKRNLLRHKDEKHVYIPGRKPLGIHLIIYLPYYHLYFHNRRKVFQCFLFFLEIEKSFLEKLQMIFFYFHVRN